ncbi:MAG: threonine aldolase family protein [Chloroflexota bacterium]
MPPINGQQFASDNYSGICPEAVQALNAANQGHVLSYGDDPWTAEAADLIREAFETDCEVFFVFNGTAANSLALASLCRSYHSIVCADSSHIETDECGAPEFYSNGAKLLVARNSAGKLAPPSIEELVTKRSDIHYPKPKAVSVTQATELGTVYTPAELLNIYRVSKKHNLKLHMDGARFANAVAALGLTPKEISWQCGVDVLCLGGSKNGLAIGEAVVFFNKTLAEDFAYRCKQAGQLASKMRFIAAPWAGILKDGAWLQHAAHANRCARLLENELRTIPEIEIASPCEANSVFVNLPPKIALALEQKGWHFYTFIGGSARFMCSWDTSEESIRALIEDMKSVIREV